jgi:fimbrial isopeptide formation D2 family protein/LPXTG-motif cell wall-anchored protein
MKKMKKLFAMLIAMVMVFAMSATALAATIDVQSVIDGEKYTAYKILNYTNSGTAYSYYLTSDEYTTLGSALEDAGFEFKASADGSQYVVDNADTIDVAAAAERLASANIGDALGKFTATGANGSATFTGLTKGYYFVTTTAGSLCALHSDVDIATAVEKNTITTPDKKQGAEAGQYDDAQLDVNIGDTVYYDAEIKIGKGANYAITGTDTLSAGLTLNHADGEITVKVGEEDVPAANYELNATDSGFTITFTAAYVSTLEENDVIKIEYSAVVNENAIIRGENPNTWEIEYSKQHEKDETVVKTYDIQVKKVDDKNAFLGGAGFKLYDAATDGNQIKVAKDNTGYYVDAETDKEIMIESADGANVRGLAPGTYYLEETTVPDGYKKLSARKPVTVEKDATAVAEITVINEPGAELPSTGGMGTTIFYALGAVLVIGAGVVLATRRRNAQ